MQAFIDLRQRARERRDKAVNLVREEHAATWSESQRQSKTQSAAARQRIGHFASCINSVPPSDRPITTLDAMAALEAMDLGTPWRKRSVERHISRLGDRGIVRELCQARWARASPVRA